MNLIPCPLPIPDGWRPVLPEEMEKPPGDCMTADIDHEKWRERDPNFRGKPCKDPVLFYITNAPHPRPPVRSRWPHWDTICKT